MKCLFDELCCEGEITVGYPIIWIKRFWSLVGLNGFLK